jgi:hypothetical protein
MKRARLDVEVVGRERAEGRFVLDPAEQVVIGRVRLEDDRRAAALVVADENVRLIAREERLPGLMHSGRDRLGELLLSGLRLPEAVEVVDHVLADALEPGPESLRFGVALLDLVDDVTDREHRDLAIELPDLLGALALDLSETGHRGGHPVLDLGDRVLKLAALGRVELGELGRRDRPIVDHGNGHEPGRRQLEGEPALDGERAEL